MQASYIMKLFDRSVNLAKFKENTPLYPLCRSWMANAPRSNQEITYDKYVRQDFQVEEGDVVEMPKVRIRKTKTTSARAEIKINKKELDKQIDSETWTKEKLLDFHRERWTEDRRLKSEALQNFKEKYFAANLELLESLIKEE
jgi:hypothetical protein